jgi:hypothetical protein
LFAKQLNNNFSKRWKTKAEEKIVPKKLILLYSFIESYTKARSDKCANPTNLACLKRAKYVKLMYWNMPTIPIAPNKSFL